jgi:hypothetical protein
MHDTPDLAAFERLFRPVAAALRWQLTPAGAIRCRLHGRECCPVQALAHANDVGLGKDREPPLTAEKAAHKAGLSMVTTVAVVHLSDNLTASRWWSAETREWLLGVCRLRARTEGAAA